MCVCEGEKERSSALSVDPTMGDARAWDSFGDGCVMYLKDVVSWVPIDVHSASGQGVGVSTLELSERDAINAWNLDGGGGATTINTLIFI